MTYKKTSGLAMCVLIQYLEIPRSQTGYLNMVRNNTILASVAALEVATTSTFFWIVVGPLSSAFGIRHWIRWMIK